MLVYDESGTVYLTDSATSKEEWKVITGAATLTGYGIKDVET